MNQRIFTMRFSRVYPLYVKKAEKKGCSLSEVDEIIHWLTGYTEEELQKQLENEVTFQGFFEQAPKLNSNRQLITSMMCGVRSRNDRRPSEKEIRYLDKLIDELAKGKKMNKILRS